MFENWSFLPSLYWNGPIMSTAHAPGTRQPRPNPEPMWPTQLTNCLETIKLRLNKCFFLFK